MKINYWIITIIYRIVFNWDANAFNFINIIVLCILMF